MAGGPNVSARDVLLDLQRVDQAAVAQHDLHLPAEERTLLEARDLGRRAVRGERSVF